MDCEIDCYIALTCTPSIVFDFIQNVLLRTIGIPVKMEKNTPVQAVARMVSTAPMWKPVLVPYKAPNVKVGAITVMNMRRETETVFWLKFVISLTQCVPTVRLKSATKPFPQD
jgi:hypothetical protein